QCPTRAVVEATRHPRRQQPPRPAQRPDAKPDRPGQRLRGVSIHTLPAHSLSCCPRHAPPSSQKRRQTTRATRICGKPVVLRSPRHRPESWRSQLGARSATPHCIPVSPHAFWSIRRTSRLAVVNALQDQLGMRSGQVETGWTSVDVGWVSTSAEGSQLPHRSDGSGCPTELSQSINWLRERQWQEELKRFAEEPAPKGGDAWFRSRSGGRTRPFV